MIFLLTVGSLAIRSLSVRSLSVRSLSVRSLATGLFAFLGMVASFTQRTFLAATTIGIIRAIGNI